MTRDRIRLHGLTFFGFHGVDPAERSLGQRFVVDLTIARDLAAAGRTDDLTQTTNYATVFKRVRAIVTGEPCLLVEHLADKIAREILSLDPAIEEVTVLVRKPWAPIKESVLDWVGVEITRDRSAL